MAITESDHRILTLAAGDTFAWPTTGSRPASDIRSGLMAFLESAAGGVCAFCGGALGAWEVGHIVSGGPGRRGWIPRNLAAACLDCNDLDGATHAVIPFDTIVRPDLVPSEWPGNAELRALGKARKAENEARREAKRKARGM